MANYIFYTYEGYTFSPDNTRVSNAQILGAANGKNVNDAMTKLIKSNPWIEEKGFDREKIKHYKIIDNQIANNLKTLIDYMWDDEQNHFEEYDEVKPKDHIYLKLKKLKRFVD